jgi:hypothetical protein
MGFSGKTLKQLIAQLNRAIAAKLYIDVNSCTLLQTFIYEYMEHMYRFLLNCIFLIHICLDFYTYIFSRK